MKKKVILQQASLDLLLEQIFRLPGGRPFRFSTELVHFFIRPRLVGSQIYCCHLHGVTVRLLYELL